ncbi:Necrosis inducing protein NPP1 [Phytophthora megakarya]|uniref:Necrosis inducing protein NPP1 n=1 Tax=Phytophthora megakarya TaxID=4795 RepID=A0A225WIJ2_9STRA|nr:Necrosis inducing protein NPP1 [Phytophthora megakarya]
MEYEGKWAIMYAWFFPKDMRNSGVVKKGVRYDWVNMVVWIDNPALAQPTILATSASTYGIRYELRKPPKARNMINGITAMVQYDEGDDLWHTIFPSEEEGEYQDLIQWDQLTDAARAALETADFGDVAKVPFNTANFENNLKLSLTY